MERYTGFDLARDVYLETDKTLKKGKVKKEVVIKAPRILPEARSEKQKNG